MVVCDSGWGWGGRGFGAFALAELQERPMENGRILGSGR